MSLISQNFLHSLVLEDDQVQTCGVVLLHHQSTHRSLLLQLFNINSLQISLSRWFIFTNNTHRAAFLLSPCPHPFTVCLTRQLHFRGAERQALSRRVCTDGTVTLLSYCLASIKKMIYTHVSVWIHKPLIFKEGDMHEDPHTASCLRGQICREEKKKCMYMYFGFQCVYFYRIHTHLS